MVASRAGGAGECYKEMQLYDWLLIDWVKSSSVFLHFDGTVRYVRRYRMFAASCWE